MKNVSTPDVSDSRWRRLCRYLPLVIVAASGWMLVLLVWGTLIQSAGQSTEAVRAHLYDTWLILFRGWVPLPGMKLMLALVCLVFIQRLVAGRGGWRDGLGMRLTETGLLLLLAGSWITGTTVTDARMVLMEGGGWQQEALAGGGEVVTLPFSLRLNKFEHTVHPGSRIPSRYASYLEIKDDDDVHPGIVEMNKPLRHRGYSFYQFSYAELGPVMTSTLIVTRRPIRHLPAVATGLVTLGLFLHVVRSRSAMARHGLGRVAILIGLLWLAPGIAAASNPPPPAALADIPILFQGRIMPLDTFARLQWRQVTGQTAPANFKALSWLAEVWFDPDRSVSNQVFIVREPETARLVGITWPGHRPRVAYAELTQSRNALFREAEAISLQPPSERGATGREILRLASAMSAYESLPLVRRRGLVPVQRDDRHAWVSIVEALAPPWMASADDPGVGTWRILAEAYREGDAQAFSAAAQRWQQYVRNTAPADIPFHHVRWEVRLNRADPFRRAAMLYLIAFLAMIAFFMADRRPLRIIAMLCMLAGFGLQTAGFLVRTVLLGRPPVTNLHSTFLFAAWVAAVFGLVSARRRDAQIGLLTAPPLAFLLLLGAEQLSATGDTLAQLPAILDSNLWLGLHVITIMIGFGGCLFAAALAHVQLLAECRPARNQPLADIAARMIPGAAGAGLAFTLLGTLLGGLWAEVGWGRFWGWDPKENGALIVIIWFVCLWEGARAGWLRPRWAAAVAWTGGWVTMLAWQGVNLLGTGRHSYGRSDDWIWLTAAMGADLALLIGVLIVCNSRSLRERIRSREIEKSA